MSESAPKFIVLIFVLVTTITTLHGQEAQYAGVAKVEMRSTSLLPQVLGEVGIHQREDHIEIRAEFSGLQAATRFGPEYLTYVMWAISPDGCVMNLGEVAMNNVDSTLNAEVDIAALGLIVTAEPYFAVSRPSEVVVMESNVARDLIGHEQLETQYQLLATGSYTANVPRSQLKPIVMDSDTPLDLYEARNALWIALWAGADKNAANLFDKALRSLQRAEAFHASGSGTDVVVTAARESIQAAENARVTALRARPRRSLSE